MNREENLQIRTKNRDVISFVLRREPDGIIFGRKRFERKRSSSLFRSSRFWSQSWNERLSRKLTLSDL